MTNNETLIVLLAVALVAYRMGNKKAVAVQTPVQPITATNWLDVWVNA